MLKKASQREVFGYGLELEWDVRLKEEADSLTQGSRFSSPKIRRASSSVNT